MLRPFSVRMTGEEYQLDLIEAIKDDYVIIITARPDYQRVQTMENVLRKTGRKAGFQRGVVKDPTSVIIPRYFVWCIKETSDMVKILSTTSDGGGTLLQLFIKYDFVTY